MDSKSNNSVSIKTNSIFNSENNSFRASNVCSPEIEHFIAKTSLAMKQDLDQQGIVYNDLENDPDHGWTEPVIPDLRQMKNQPTPANFPAILPPAHPNSMQAPQKPPRLFPHQPPERATRLPVARIKNMMKVDPDTPVISPEAAFCLAKAAEKFIEVLSKQSYAETINSKRKTLARKDLTMGVEKDDRMVHRQIYPGQEQGVPFRTE